MNNWQISVDATNTALNSQGSAMEEQERYAESLEARINKLQNSWTEFSLAVGDAVLTDTLIELIEGLRDLAQSSSNFVSKFGVLPALFGTIGVAVTALSGKFRGLAASLLFGAQGMTRTTVAANALKIGLRGLASATVVGAVFVGIGYALEKFIGYLGKAREEQEKFEQDQKTTVDALTTHKEKTEELIDSYKKLSAQKNSGIWNSRNEEEYLSIQTELADLMPNLVASIDSKGQAHLKSVDDIDKEILATQELIKLKREEMVLNAEQNFNKQISDRDSTQSEIDDLNKQIENYKNTESKIKGADLSGMINKTKQEIVGLESQMASTNSKIASDVLALIESMNSLNSVDLDSGIKSEIEELVNSLDLSSLTGEQLKQFAQNVSTYMQDIQRAFESGNEVDFSKASDGLKEYARSLGATRQDLNTFILDYDNLRAATENANGAIESQIPIYDELGNIVGYSTQAIEGLTDAQDENTNSKLSNISATEVLWGITADMVNEAQAAIGIIQALSGVQNLSTQQSNLLSQATAILANMFPQLNGKIAENIGWIQNEIGMMAALNGASGGVASVMQANQNSTTRVVAEQSNQRIQILNKELAQLNKFISAYEASIVPGVNDNLNVLMGKMYVRRNFANLELASARSSAVQAYYGSGVSAGVVRPIGGGSSGGGSRGGSGGSSGSGSKSSTAKEREIEQYYTDKYAQAVDALNVKIEESEYRMSRLDNTSKAYRDELAKQISYQNQLGKLAKNEQSRLESRNRSLQSQLKLMGSFNRLSNENKEKYNDIANEIDDNIKKINDLKSTQISASRAINSALDNMKDVYNDIADDIVDIYKDMYSKQKQIALDAIDDELDAYRKAHNEKLAMIDKEADKEDYEKNLQQRQQEIQRIQSEINLLSMDDSLSARARMAELQKQLAEEQLALDEFLSDRQRDLRKQSLEEELASKEEELNEKRDKTEQYYDNLINDERSFTAMREQILKGHVSNLQKDLKIFSSFIKDNMTEIGKSISQNLLDKLAEAKGILSGLSGKSVKVSGGTNLLGFASGGYTGNSEGLAVLHKKEIVLNRNDTKNLLDTIKLLRPMSDFLGNIKIPEIPKLNPSVGTPNQVHVSMPINMTVTGDEQGGRDALKVINKGLKDMGLKLNL